MEPDSLRAARLTNGGTVLDDSQSYDVYTQIARLVKEGPSSGPNPFAGLAVRDVYAGGVSQSATFLVRYYNGLQAAARAYDGFLVGLGGGVPRSDVGAKLMKVYTETDVLFVAGLASRPGLGDDPHLGGGRRLARASLGRLTRPDGLPCDARWHPGAGVRAGASR